MKAIKYISLVVLLAWIVGCSTTTTFRPWMMDQVTPGMDKAQVTELLGEPDSVVSLVHGEVLYYSYRLAADSAFRDADMMNGGNPQGDIIASDRVKKGFTPDQYAVNLKDGKVVSYEKVK